MVDKFACDEMMVGSGLVSMFANVRGLCVSSTQTEFLHAILKSWGFLHAILMFLSVLSADPSSSARRMLGPPSSTFSFPK